MITRNDIEKFIAAKFADTGWIEVPASWLASNITQGGTALMYRVIGNKVYFRGGLKTVTSRNIGITYTILTLPSSLYPDTDKHTPQTNGNYDYCVCNVSRTDGVMKWNNKGAALGANGAMLLHLSYLTD